MTRPRRGRALRGREPRRPFDRRPRRLHQHELLRHQHRDGHRAPARDGPGRAHRHRRGVRIGRGRLVEGDRSARAALAVLGVEGRLRPHRALVPPHLRPAGGRDALHEQLRAVPVPGEGDPALHHQPARRRQDPALRRRPQRARLDLRRRPLRRRAPRAASRASRARSTTSAPATRRRTACSSTSCSRCSARTRASVDYVDRPARPRPPLLRRHRQDHRARLEASSARSTRRSPRPSSGTATTAGGGSRSRPVHEGRS